MELRWMNDETREIGVAFVMDSDAVVLRAMGWDHVDDETSPTDGEWVEIWKPNDTK